MGAILDFYKVWDEAYVFFNQELFDGSLSPVVFTVESQRTTHAYYHPNRFTVRDADGEKLHKISMNESSLQRTDELSMSTLVHEMVHHWQQLHGSPGRGKYHNAQWAAAMLDIGLPPMSRTTGEKGTGDKVSHSIAPGGRFEEAFKKWEKLGFSIGHEGIPRAPVSRAKRKSKTKYTCDECDSNVWGKSGLDVYCGCGGVYEEQ